LRSAPAEAGKLVVTDGVFSMEGDIVHLDEIAAVARRHGARLYLDEAHAIGVTGATGRGTEEHFGQPLADLVMCTFSKSFGSIGGFVAGDREVVNYIKHEGRPLIFSASMPPANLAAAAAALKIMREEPERAQRLQRISARMIREYKTLGFDVDVAETAIVPLIIGDDHLTFRFWRALFEAGIYANPVVTPGVPPGRALIRTSYMAIHTDDELDRVLEIAATVGRRLGII
jgi:7-keto-8-aminopelargonate synthetase-like enzyme